MAEHTNTKISEKPNNELLKELSESKFHQKEYIDYVIAVLKERNINESQIFENYKTDDLVVILCFDFEKHQIQYLELIKKELKNRNYNLESIPNIKDPKTFSPNINSDTPSYSSSAINRNSNKSVYGITSIFIVVLVIVIVKFGLFSVQEKEKGTNENQVKVDSLLYGQNGLIEQEKLSLKKQLDVLKQDSSFRLNDFQKNDILEYEISRIDSAFGVDLYELDSVKTLFLESLRTELKVLLEKY
jgi:hypothetical protein